MALKYTGDAIIKVGLSVKTPKPIDDRLVVQTRADLFAINPAYAYEGMAVAVIESGSINTLVNKSRIAYPDGWSSSFENVKFVTCTKEEFDQWYANTENFQPIDPKLPYIVEDVYYYIYEESMDGDTQLQEYVTAAQLIVIEGRVSKTAEEAAAARKKLSEEIAQDIITSQNELKTYVEQHFVNNDFLEGIDSDGLTGLLSKYYTIESADTTFVKKDELVITADDGSKTYTYLPTSQYIADQAALTSYKQQIARELAGMLKTNTEGSLTVLTLETLKLGTFNITAKEDGIYVGLEKIAYHSNLPKFITLTREEYKRLEEDGELDPDTYYYIEEIEDYYVLNSQLDSKLKSYATEDSVASKLLKYVTIESLNTKLEGLNGNISATLETYYTKTEIDNTLVTKEALATELQKYVTKELLGGGDSNEGQHDYIFVTKNEYEEDQSARDQVIQEYLDEKVDKDSDTSLKSVSVPLIKNGETMVKLDNQKIYINDYPVALDKNVPKIKVISQHAYDEMTEFEPDVYYMTYNREEEDAWVTANILKNYYSKAQVDDMFAQTQRTINNLRAQLEAAQGAISTLMKIHEDREEFVADYFADLINGEIVEEPTTLTEDELFNKIIGE